MCSPAGLHGCPGSTPSWRHPARTTGPGGTALITVLPAAEACEPAGQRTVATVRSATAHDPAVAGIGGVGVEIIDFTAATYGNLWKMLALIALVTFGLLAVAFR